MKQKSNELIKTIKLKSLSSEIVKKTESHFRKNFLNLFKNALTNQVNKNSQNQNFLTKKISHQNKSLQNSKNSSNSLAQENGKLFLIFIKILENIFQLYSQEDLKKRDLELRRYLLIKFLDCDLQFELDSYPNLNSDELNNRILVDKFIFNEKDCDLFLHKRVKDYYILINFSYLTPELDRKLLMEYMNSSTKDYKDNFQTKSMFHKSIGLYDNSEIKEKSKVFT